MGKRQFKTASRAGNTIYWVCPGSGCEDFYHMIETGGLPRTVNCKCGTLYIVRQLTQFTDFTARVLIEVKQ
jgi:hypothetical protein